MSIRLASGLVCVVVVLVGSGCSSDGVDGDRSTLTTIPEVTATGSNLGGDRLPVQIPGEPIVHASVPVTGTFILEPNGCWTVDLGDRTRLVVLPVGTTRPPDDGSVLMVPEGVEVSSGLQFDGLGGVVASTSVPGGADGFWGNYVSFCDPGALEIAVLDVVVPALDVAALTDEQILALVRGANLTRMWGCGIGFAASNEDQSVVVRVYAADTGDPSFDDVRFPDPGWTATVSVGSLLMANHCDDVSEGWEADPKEAVSLPVVAGTLSFTRLPDSLCGADRAAATLTGATVLVGDSRVLFDELALENDAFGCFAG